jgi:hypothetical protein
MNAPEDKQFFTPRHVMVTKDKRGETYEPANGPESECFEELWCSQCVRYQRGCRILMALYLRRKPKQVRYGDDGHPLCTAYLEVLEDAEEE